MKNTFTFIDARLSRRADYSLAKIQKSPDQSLPQIFSNYADLEGFYRLIKNRRLTMDDVLREVTFSTQKICEPIEEVAIIHDTTFINPKSNLRNNFIGSRGLMTHMSLAVSTSSAPEIYGVAGLDFVKRSKEGKKAVNLSESYRWLEGVRRTEDQFLREKTIHLMDRESDSFENLEGLCKNGRRFVIRASHNRPIKNGAKARLFDSLRATPASFKLEASLSKRDENKFKSEKKSKIHPKRESRKTELSISAASFKIYYPRAKKSSSEYEVNAVRVWEESPPKGESPIEWILITSESVNAPDEIKKVINLYRRRWLVEEFFKGLKTGCRIEDKQFEDIESWKKLIAFYLPVTTSIMNLRLIDKVCLSSLKISLSSGQIKILEAASKYKIKDSEALLYALAGLGGHIKYNGPPGWQTLHKGMKKLITLQEGWELRCD